MKRRNFIINAVMALALIGEIGIGHFVSPPGYSRGKKRQSEGRKQM